MPKASGTRPLVTRRALLAAGAGAGILIGAGYLTQDSHAGPAGRIMGSGSNTVAPITDIAGEDFMATYGGAAVVVAPEGTGAGFQEFCRGNSDIQSASREMLTEEDVGEGAIAEADLCDDHGIDYTRFTVGRDGLAVGVSEHNDWCEEITLDELTLIWDFESDVERWNDVRDEWPDERIALHGRDSGSGTFDYFTREINGDLGAIRDDYSATSQTDEIWDAVADNPHALGWGAVGHLRGLQRQGGTIRTVAVESDEEPGQFYHPTTEEIETGRYTPLARPLYVFVSHRSLVEKPDLIGSFLRYFINNQQGLAREVDFFAEPDEQVVANHDRLDDLLIELDIDPDGLTVGREG